MTLSATVIGRKGFREVFSQWKITEGRLSSLVGELNDLGPQSYRLLERQCARLSAREALAVIRALDADGLGFSIESGHPLKTRLQQQMGRWQLAFNARKLIALAPACCALVSADGSPHTAMSFASVRSQETTANIRQAFKEPFFGLSAQRENSMRGIAIWMISSYRVPQEETEWFGTNWEAVLPFWERLLAGSSVTRSRFDALANDDYEETPAVLMDGTL